MSDSTTVSLPTISESGLTKAQVEDRIERGQVNIVRSSSSRSIQDIIRANVFTLFNGIIITAMVLVLITGSWRDAVFGFVVIINTGIGILTELRAKRTLDALSILVASNYMVHRDGRNIEVPSNNIVLDDLLWLRAGEQVPADATIVQTWGLELDESMITGESRTVRKQPNDTVYSGSTVIAGMALVHVTAVGEHSYAATLTAQAKVYKKNISDLNKGINTILRFMTFLVVPLCVILIITQMNMVGGFAHAFATGAWRGAIVSAVAGVVGMIPEGLVLLTSLNFALAAIRLARKNTLVQDLDSVETLARVDSLNLDKTGTITDGTIVYDNCTMLPASHDAKQTLQALYDVADEPSPNATGQAVLNGLQQQGITAGKVAQRIPFSSDRKWSAISYGAHDGVWIMGAPEVVIRGLHGDYSKVLAQVDALANDGNRVLLIAYASGDVPSDFATNPQLDPQAQPMALVTCSEHIRDDAEGTLAWFREQGVRCRVISGDNPVTVGAIATKVKLTGDRKPVTMDAHDLPDNIDEMARVLENVDVLGRVLPEQKKAIVDALHTQHHVVAMTGDGVNDTLAIKEADLGIAMGNAAPATKAVAEIVLLDSKFSHLPDVVARGRQVMANMERVSNLFLTKTVYSALIAFGVVFTFIPFPYLPRHISYISGLTIGAPAFLLALAPNTRRYIPGFLRRVFAFSVPSGIAVGAATLIAAWSIPAIMHWDVASSAHELSLWRSMCATLLFLMGIVVLARVASPLRSWRGWLVAAFATIGIVGMLIPFVAHFFAFIVPTGTALLVFIGELVMAGALFALTMWLVPHFLPATMRALISQYRRVRKS